jgi:hypothetical protein
MHVRSISFDDDLDETHALPQLLFRFVSSGPVEVYRQGLERLVHDPQILLRHRGQRVGNNVTKNWPVYFVEVQTLRRQLHDIRSHVRFGPLEQALLLKAGYKPGYGRLVPAGRLRDLDLMGLLLDPQVLQNTPLLGRKIGAVRFEGPDDGMPQSMMSLIEPEKAVRTRVRFWARYHQSTFLCIAEKSSRNCSVNNRIRFGIAKNHPSTRRLGRQFATLSGAACVGTADLAMPARPPLEALQARAG